LAAECGADREGTVRASRATQNTAWPLLGGLRQGRCFALERTIATPACGTLAGMNTNQIAHIAALVGEPARTGMLLALMDGRALTARELADAAHITPATASRHLALLVEARLLSVQSQGRHRYHRLATPEVARLLEGLMQLAVGQAPATRPVAVGPRDAALRQARTCYDHIAGRLGVAVAEHLLEEGAIVFDGEAGGQVTDRAASVLGRLGLDLGGEPAGGAVGGDGSGRSGSSGSSGRAGRSQRPLCRPCLDWSERRPHMAGRLGALVCTHCLDQGWLLRRDGSRALGIAPPGAAALRDWLGTARWGAVVAQGPSGG